MTSGLILLVLIGILVAFGCTRLRGKMKLSVSGTNWIGAGPRRGRARAHAVGLAQAATDGRQAGPDRPGASGPVLSSPV